MNAYMSYKVSTQVHKSFACYHFWIDQATYIRIMPLYHASLSLSRLHYPCSLIRRFLCDDVSVIFWDFMRRYRPNTLCWAASSLLRLRRVQLVKNFSCSLWLLVQWSYSSALIQTLTLAWIHENVYSELSVGSYLHHFILSSPV